MLTIQTPPFWQTFFLQSSMLVVQFCPLNPARHLHLKHYIYSFQNYIIDIGKILSRTGTILPCFPQDTILHFCMAEGSDCRRQPRRKDQNNIFQLTSPSPRSIVH